MKKDYIKKLMLKKWFKRFYRITTSNFFNESLHPMTS